MLCNASTIIQISISNMILEESTALHCKPSSYLTHEFPDNGSGCEKRLSTRHQTK